MKKTQIEQVTDRLLKFGYVDNFWAVKNNILRLGAIIHAIKSQGLISIDIVGCYGNNIANYNAQKKVANRKNWHYILRNRMRQQYNGEIKIDK